MMPGPRCYRCACLESKDFQFGAPGQVENLAYRCSKGFFDVTLKKEGGKAPRYFAWSGIVGPNKTVRQAQKDCREFKPGSPR